jgi:nitroreductase
MLEEMKMEGIEELLQARYAGAENNRTFVRGREGLRDKREALPNTLETLLGHRSVRAFTASPLSEGTLEWLVAAAQSAANSANQQTWSVVAVQDEARKQRLSVLAGNQAHIREAPLFLAWLVDLSRLRRLSERAQSPGEGLDYLETFLVGVVDAALAAQNAVTAAEALGLGTVYIGGLRNRPTEVAEELALPHSTFAVFGLCVGHPDPARPTAIKPRLPQSSVLFREQYRSGSIEEEIDSYDAVMNAFYASQRQPAKLWSQVAVDRIASVASLRGRDRLREALAKLGFPLR